MEKKMDEYKLEFEPFIIYESIVCTNFPGNKKINSSCMGVHFTPTDEVYLHVYEKTDTSKLLEVGKKFSINFTDNFTDYARAALLGKDTGEDEPEIPIEEFEFQDNLPLLKSGWCSVLCEVIHKGANLMIKPPCKRRETPNFRAKILTVKIRSFPRIFNNRSMNLAIEGLILTTRIPLSKYYSSQFNDSLKMYKSFKKKIIEWRDMDRFENGYQIMDNYLIDKGLKPQDIFDLDDID